MSQQGQFEISAPAVSDGTTHSSRERGEIEGRTIRKLQLRLLPFLFLLYVISFVDRINIGFAALTMNKQLAMTSQQFGFAAGVFFFGYCLFEVPSNLLLHKIGARIWIARILISWGILATLTGFVHTIHQLYWLRFLLGLAEAGYFPGIVLYLTYWFRQREQARVLALFLTAVPVTSIVGAPISGLILDHAHWLAVSSWRWLLILEGLPAVLFGVLTYFVLPNRPADAKFLTAEEKEWLSASLLCEERKKLEQGHYSVVQALLNPRVLCLGIIELGIVTCSYTLNFWAPQLIKSFSNYYSNTTVGLLVMIPYLVGAVVMVLVSRSSDRNLERRYHAGIPVMLGGIGLLLMGVFHSPVAVVLLLSLLAIGAYGWCAPFFSLPCEFLTGSAVAAGVALINSIGNIGGFVGPYAVGVASSWTGGIHGAFAPLGIPMLLSATGLLLLPKNAPASRLVRNHPSGLGRCAEVTRASVVQREGCLSLMNRQPLAPLGAVSTSDLCYKGISFVATQASDIGFDYALGYTTGEHERLIRQAALIAPYTERLFRQAGIGRGQRVLDVGSGVGDVSMLLARIVGPSGEVVGIERDASSIARAESRAVAAGLYNISFIQTDVSNISSDKLFDAAVGRFILLFLPDPVAVLRGITRLVRPGGAVAFQEPSWIPLLGLGSRLPLWSRVLHSIHETSLRCGLNPEMGPDLFRVFQQAGLPAPAMHMEIPLGSDAEFTRILCEVLFSLAPRAENSGVSLQTLGDFATLPERVQAEVTASKSVVSFLPLVGAWSRQTPPRRVTCAP